MILQDTLKTSEREPKGKAADEIAQAYNWIEGPFCMWRSPVSYPTLVKSPASPCKITLSVEGNAPARGDGRIAQPEMTGIIQAADATADDKPLYGCRRRKSAEPLGRPDDGDVVSLKG